MSAGTTDGAIDWAGMHARIKAAMDGLERGFEPDAGEVERRLRERAARLARAGAVHTAPADEIHILEFEIGGRSHGVDSRFVREVCAGMTPTRVPQAPSWAAGVVHLRGDILTVMDLGALTGGGAAGDGEGPLLILHAQGRAIGMATDAIHGLRAVARSALDPVPATVQGHRRFYLGVTQQDALVLDAGAFFEDGALTGTGADGAAGTRGS